MPPFIFVWCTTRTATDRQCCNRPPRTARLRFVSFQRTADVFLHFQNPCFCLTILRPLWANRFQRQEVFSSAEGGIKIGALLCLKTRNQYETACHQRKGRYHPMKRAGVLIGEFALSTDRWVRTAVTATDRHRQLGYRRTAHDFQNSAVRFKNVGAPHYYFLI